MGTYAEQAGELTKDLLLEVQEEVYETTVEDISRPGSPRLSPSLASPASASGPTSASASASSTASASASAPPIHGHRIRAGAGSGSGVGLSAEGKVKVLEGALAQHRDQLAQTRKLVASLEDEATGLRRELEHSRHELADIVSSKDSHIQSLTAQLNEARTAGSQPSVAAFQVAVAGGAAPAANDSVASLEARIEELEDALIEIREERDMYKRMAQAVKEPAVPAQPSQDLMTRNEELRTALERATAQLDVFRVQQEQLVAQLTHETSVIGRGAAGDHDTESPSEALLSSVEQCVAHVVAERDALAAENAKLVAKLDSSRQVHDQTESTVEGMRTVIVELNATNAKLTAELAAARDAAAAEVQQAQAQLASATRDAEELRNQLAQAEASARADASQQTQSLLAQRDEALAAARDRVAAAERELANERVAAANSLASERAAVSERDAELAALRSRLEVAQQAAAAAEDARAKLALELDAARTTIDAKIAQARESREAAMASDRALAETQSRAQAAAETAASRIRELEAAVAAARSNDDDAAHAQAAAAAAAARVSELESTLAAVQQEGSAGAARISELESALAAARGTTAEQARALEEAQHAAGRAAELENELREASQQLVRLGSELENSRVQAGAKDALEAERAHVQALSIQLQKQKQALAAAEMERTEMAMAHQRALTEVTEPYAKARKDLERLKAHLIESEERHAAKVLASDKELAALRAQLDLQGRASSETHEATAAELKETRAALEASREQASTLNAQVERLATENRNLVSVVDQLQESQDELVAARVDEATEALTAAQAKVAALEAELDQVPVLQRELAEAREVGARTQARLSHTTTELHTVQDELVAIKASMQKMMAAQQALTASDARIDKALVANLLVTYFTKADAEKAGVLSVLSSMLDLDEEQQAAIGVGAGAGLTGWISSWFGPTSSGSAGSAGTSASGKGLSDLWVEFLLMHADAPEYTDAGQDAGPSDGVDAPVGEDGAPASSGLAAITSGVAAV
ncbi:uncharacterized protein AMSG_02016 [Thecamonas trahens ATCC 50062]|uniref:GRIP domain-containing protein n=1 Tax=Thecamonas trahens ATCC 50062 TaxID=461836 RepID=A0A0L0DWT5_THETB|nr:hypothetical protein AMSG_02016 [Thecamonas trahens ATCC 50062]KNC56003.1 hypothetical protein AMSG_02016 [Thecamonas trahens ATCC 50062]|eukprot:XP_013761049.1 hypothetical protein AMSG_02016 [Thecamonas trahens ATCC 50062]